MELMGVAIAWEKLVLSDVFSKSEALRTVFKLPVPLMQMEEITGAAGTHQIPTKKARRKVLVIAFTGLWLFPARSLRQRVVPGSFVVLCLSPLFC